MADPHMEQETIFDPYDTRDTCKVRRGIDCQGRWLCRGRCVASPDRCRWVSESFRVGFAEDAVGSDGGGKRRNCRPQGRKNDDLDRRKVL